MEKLRFIIQHEIIATLRRPFFLIFALGAPLVMAIVALVLFRVNQNAPLATEAEPASVQPSSLPDGLLDLAGIAPPDRITSENWQLYASESAARTALEAGEIGGFYRIPADYVASGKVDYISLKASPLLLNVKAAAMGRMLAFGLLASDPALAEAVFNPIQLQVTALGEQDPDALAENWFVSRLPMFMVILLYMVILVPATSLVSSLLEEKKNRVLEVLLCSVSPMQLFVGKLLAVGFLGLVQTFLWISVVWGVGNLGGQPLQLPAGYTVPLPLLIWGLLFSLLGYMMYGAQMAGLGAMAPELSETRSVSLLILSPLLVGYIFSLQINEVPFSPLAYVLSYFPLTAPVAMISRLSAAELPFWEPLLSAVIQLLAVVWLVRTFGRLFQARLMLSGQPVNIRSMWAALRSQN